MGLLNAAHQRLFFVRSREGMVLFGVLFESVCFLLKQAAREGLHRVFIVANNTE